TTSWLPSAFSAITRLAPQSENQTRPSCQRGDSPNTMPSIRTSGTLIIFLPLWHSGPEPQPAPGPPPAATARPAGSYTQGDLHDPPLAIALASASPAELRPREPIPAPCRGPVLRTSEHLVGVSLQLLVSVADVPRAERGADLARLQIAVHHRRAM